MGARGGDGEDGTEGGGALSVACEEGDGAPEAGAPAGVEVGDVGAGGGGVVVVGLDEEGVGAGAVVIVFALDGDGEVGGAAHGVVGVVDCDAEVVEAVEGDADGEAGENVFGVDVEPFSVVVVGGGVLGMGGCAVGVPLVDRVAGRVEMEDFVGVGEDGGVDEAVADDFVVAGRRIDEEVFCW